jgi:hypothetical protein
MAIGWHVIPFNDYNAERSTVTVRATELTAANFDAQYSAFIQFYDAIVGITLGLRIGAKFGNDIPIVAGDTPASDPNAQRERKWLVRYSDATAMKNYTMELPCADLSYLDPNNREYADMTDLDVAAFVTAFEAFVISPDGNTVTVDSIQHVGRNL